MKTHMKSRFLLPVVVTGLGSLLAGQTSAQIFTTLHSFTATKYDSDTNSTVNESYTNWDGAMPHAGLILSGTTLYWTASGGGSSGSGTVFALDTNGTGFTTLHSFVGGSDGSDPKGAPLISGTTLYGAVSYGGSKGGGTIFPVNTDGTGF